MQDFAGRRVLLIDQNTTNRLIFREALVSWGLIVVESASVEEAAAELKQGGCEANPLALVILDCQIPVRDGFEAVSRIRQAVPQIPTVLLSSDSRPGDATRCHAFGVSGLAIRPVKRSDLLRLVCDAFGVWKQPEPGESNQIPAARSSGDPAQRGLRILVAEDSIDNRILVQAYLKGGPHSVTFVEDGSRAIDQYLSEEFDLILMDMQMPVMDGLTATAGIRKLELEQGRKPVPIVALTANAFVQDIKNSQLAGCQAHLSKPISRQKLLSAIEQYGRSSVPKPVLDPIIIDVPEGLEELAPTYLEARRREVSLLLELLSASDHDRIRRLAHNIKGSGGGYGFAELTSIGASIEIAASEGSVPRVKEHLAELSEYLDRVQLPLRGGS